MQNNPFISEHLRLVRRYFLGLGLTGTVLTQIGAWARGADADDSKSKKPAKQDKAVQNQTPTSRQPPNFVMCRAVSPCRIRFPRSKRRKVGLHRARLGSWR